MPLIGQGNAHPFMDATYPKNKVGKQLKVKHLLRWTFIVNADRDDLDSVYTYDENSTYLD
jgi:hypothetical protein